MTRAVRLLCDWLFREGIGRLELRTHPDNEPSQRLAERAGFRREGLEREIDLAARAAAGRDRLVAASGRPAMTLHSLRNRTLGVIPIRLALGVVLLWSPRGSPALRAPRRCSPSSPA